MSGEAKSVELHFRCKNLKFSQSQIEVYLKLTTGWSRIGFTEEKTQDRHPKFEKTVTVFYNFSEMKQLQFRLIQPSNQQEVGTVELTLQQITAARDQVIQVNFRNKNGEIEGLLFLVGEVLKYNNDEIHLDIIPRQLVDRKFLCFQIGEMRPQLTLYRQRDGEKMIIYNSEVLEGPINQKQWNTIKCKMSRFCNFDKQQFIYADVHNADSQNLIGSTLFTPYQLVIDKINHFDLAKERELKGHLYMKNVEIKDIPTFEDYIQGGLELNVMVAIDFTDSNGDPNYANSLHYVDISNQIESPYQKALTMICELLMNYDDDKKVPVFGFGCIPPGMDQTQHCFPLNFNLEDPEVDGVDGVLEVYRRAIRTMKFDGPTLFAPIFKRAMSFAKGYKSNNSKYLILLILTDGVIQDFEQTFDYVVDCSNLPISVIVVGIGTANFDNMQRLNNDDLQQEDTYGRKATRDMIKFVEFNRFAQDLGELNQEVLSELPDQVVQYMQKNNIQPKKQAVSLEIAFENRMKYFRSDSISIYRQPQQQSPDAHSQAQQRKNNLVFIRSSQERQQEIQQQHQQQLEQQQQQQQQQQQYQQQNQQYQQPVHSTLRNPLQSQQSFNEEELQNFLKSEEGGNTHQIPYRQD